MQKPEWLKLSKSNYSKVNKFTGKTVAKISTHIYECRLTRDNFSEKTHYAQYDSQKGKSKNYNYVFNKDIKVTDNIKQLTFSMLNIS